MVDASSVAVCAAEKVATGASLVPETVIRNWLAADPPLLSVAE